MTRRVRRSVCLIVVLSGLAPALFAQQPVGDPIQLNATTARGGQTAVGMDAAGNFVVVWERLSDGGGTGIAARRFDALANPLGDEFLVNTTTTGEQVQPDIAVADNGEFVVVWRAAGAAGGVTGIAARRYDATGTALGPEFPVNTSTGLAADGPHVAADPRGGFVVAWQAHVSAAEQRNVFARRWDGAANAGSEFLVNESVTADEFAPSLGVDAAGNVVVGWFSRVDWVPSTFRGLYRRFDASDSPLGGEVLISDNGPKVGVARDGGFVALWLEPGLQVYGLHGRNFDASGVPVGPLFTAGGEVAGSPSIAMNPVVDGEFVVAWPAESYSEEGEDWYNFRNEGVSLDRNGRHIASAFTASPISPTSYVGGPDVATNGAGRFIVTWTEQTGGPSRVLARPLVAARLTGTVTDAATGLPVSQALVQAVGHWSAFTDSAGRYSFLPAPGVYNLSVHRSGFVAATATGVAVPFGETTVRDFALAPVVLDRIFADDFESGDLSAWSGASTGDGDLDASAAAAMAGTSRGLEVVVNDRQPLYVRDETPNDLARYRARFHFDPNGFDPGESAGRFRAIVFMALDESPQKRVLQLVLRRLGGVYSLRGRITLDDGTRAETPFVTIGDAPHVVEFDWVKATAPGAADGSFQLWIDGVAGPALNGLQNHDYGLDYVRLGAMMLKTGASGTMYFDRFDSRRTTYIGP